MKQPILNQANRPPYRRLRGYSFDPSLSTQLDTALINSTVFKVRWEDTSDGLKPGPMGEYVEVIDYDPANQTFYEPIDLDNPFVLAQDGLPPSEANPMFHQQMVYAVAMTTIQNFEKALGRPVLWAPKFGPDPILARSANTVHNPSDPDPSDPDAKPVYQEQFVPCLRIYPHALREANAYYSPDKVALLFGYFPASPVSASDHLPGGIVFTCLSHDVIAHETTHAILDGLHHRYIDPTHQDTLAFHEAFSDIVALFQHFSFTEVLEHQIAKTKGDLMTDNLLGQLAQQFGKAIGGHGALRDAIGDINPVTGKWQLKKPDPEAIHSVLEPHERGSLLVATIFDAFLSIYRKRTRDLIRLASGGSGILNGDIHPDLVRRLAAEASATAKQLLNICIRAIDYCPPVEITFGDYLRAMITADIDLVPDDRMEYRIALIEAFRHRGIYPDEIRNMSEESLRYPSVDMTGIAHPVSVITTVLREFQERLNYVTERKDIFNLTRDKKRELHDKLSDKFADNTALQQTLGISLLERFNNQIKLGKNDVAAFEVHSLKRARRVGPDGSSINQMIVTLTQTRQVRKKNNSYNIPEHLLPYKFRGGSTLIFDLDKMELKYAIIKGIDDTQRLENQLDFLSDWEELSFEARGFTSESLRSEPFALLHKL